MRALDRKRWRDLAQLRGQTVAIALVLVAGIAVASFEGRMQWGFVRWELALPVWTTPVFTLGKNGTWIHGSRVATRLSARNGRLAVIVFGADWCHDSTALAKVLTGETFRAEFGARFSVTFIDVGVPQDGRGRNLDLAKRFGVAKMSGTPTMVVVSPKGKRLNGKKDAYSWRNAASRDRAEVLGWFRKITAKE